MKTLIIGIDGGDERILDFFNQPYYAELKSRFHSHRLQEDLFSRGWAEIMTGLVGWDTRAFYMSPKLDGTTNLSVSFNMSEAQNNSKVKTIWNLLGEKGYKVGIMNVPTTTPAPQVNGFLIGSAGGGLDKVEGIPDALVYPSSLIPELEKNDYIVDTRLHSSGITGIEDLFDRVNTMERRRTETFVKLCREQNTDFGFVVNTGIRTIQYLAMSEIEKLMASENMNKERQIEYLLQDLYAKLDQNIQLLIDKLQPEHVIITADHGQAPYKYRGNINVFLEHHGWFIKPSASTSLLVRMKRQIKKFLPKNTQSALTKKMPSAIRTRSFRFDTKKTRAFGHYYIPGIYINDAVRFGGPVREEELPSIVDAICDTFNRSAEAVEYGMSAHPYRAKHQDAPFADYLPDIIIEKPDTIFFDSKGDKLILPNPNYGPIPDLCNVNEDMFTGIKGRHPILLMDPKTHALLRDEDPSDLTVVYRLIDRIFGD